MSEETRFGYCRCGCGQLSPIAKKTITKWGRVKGKPVRFIPGHNMRGNNSPRGDRNARWRGGRKVRDDGYIDIYSPDHPRSVDGKVLEHILVAEKALGHPLPNKAEVHHVDQNRSNNTNSNLVVCQNSAYHKLLHVRMRAKRECGHADWRKCPMCGIYSPISELKEAKPYYWYHKECNRKHQKNLRDKKAKKEAALKHV